jgi:hypothetical protein
MTHVTSTPSVTDTRIPRRTRKTRKYTKRKGVLSAWCFKHPNHLMQTKSIEMPGEKRKPLEVHVCPLCLLIWKLEIKYMTRTNPTNGFRHKG